MSGGRVELGIGAGWFEEEHRAYGIPFPSQAERFDRLDEQLQIITGLWDTPAGERFSFTGQYYRLVASPALPKRRARTAPAHLDRRTGETAHAKPGGPSCLRVQRGVRGPGDHGGAV